MIIIIHIILRIFKNETFCFDAASSKLCLYWF